MQIITQDNYTTSHTFVNTKLFKRSQYNKLCSLAQKSTTSCKNALFQRLFRRFARQKT